MHLLELQFNKMDGVKKSGLMKFLGGLSFKKLMIIIMNFMLPYKDINLNTGKIAHGGFI